MHRLDDPGACEERPENGESEGGHRKREVPHPHQAAPFLYQHRVQVGRSAQPRQQRRVLDRVPAPEATPPEDLVRPPRAEHDADRKERERHQRPAPALDLPAIPDAPRGQHADGEGEGNREPDESRVEQRRMDGDQRVVLQQRVGAEARQHLVRRDERIRRSEHEAEEERGDDEEHHGGPPDDGVGRNSAVAPDENTGEDRQDEAPQQDRPGQGGPQTGDGVQQRGDGAVVLGHEDDAEVVGDQRVLHGQDGHQRAHQHDRGEQPAVDQTGIAGRQTRASSRARTGRPSLLVGARARPRWSRRRPHSSRRRARRRSIRGTRSA